MGKKYKVIAIMGESGTGKDTILKVTVAMQPAIFHPIVSSTTRPKRDYEIDGKDYHFISEKEFTCKILNGEMLEAVEFNDWFYGSCIDDFRTDKINIGVFNPTGVDALLQDSRLDVCVIRVACDDKTRLIRSLTREKNPDCLEIIRRFKADQIDFSYLPFDYYTFENNADTPIEHLNLLYMDYPFEDWLLTAIESIR